MEAHEFDNLMEIDMDAMHAEELKPSSFLNNTADSLPGMGIVAAVLGVVITMGKISEPPEVLGHSIGAALVGTFLGILMCYGFLGPMAKAMENKVHAGGTYLTVIRTTLVTFIANSVPQIAVEAGRRAVPGKMRPSFAELEEELKKSRKK
jgi:chemotaxis protein MotA